MENALSTKLSFKLLLLTWIGTLRLWRMLWELGWWKKWKIYYSITIFSKLTSFTAMCQRRDNQIWQQQVETAAQEAADGTYFTSSPKPLTPLKHPAVALAEMVAGQTGSAPLDLSAGNRRNSVEERAKRYAPGRCLYCVGCNLRATECMASIKAPIFMAVGAEGEKVGTSRSSEESGKD